MRKILAVIIFFVLAFSLPSLLHAETVENVKMFTIMDQGSNIERAASDIGREVNKWLNEHKDIVITQRCMSISQYSNQTRIAISIFYKKK